MDCIQSIRGLDVQWKEAFVKETRKIGLEVQQSFFWILSSSKRECILSIELFSLNETFDVLLSPLPPICGLTHQVQHVTLGRARRFFEAICKFMFFCEIRLLSNSFSTRFRSPEDHWQEGTFCSMRTFCAKITNDKPPFENNEIGREQISFILCGTYGSRETVALRNQTLLVKILICLTGDAQLTIAVSSVDLRDSTLDMAQQQRQYLHKAFRFYELVSTNHQGLQDNLRDHLKQELHTAITKVCFQCRVTL